MSYRKKCICLITICFSIFLYSSTVIGDSFYPLQTKYPDIIKYKVETDDKIIALTFDDGPDNNHTPEILEVLEKHHVPATFFLLGSRVEKYPEEVKEIMKAGHDIGNHTYWHPELTKTGVANMELELNKSERSIEHVIGKKPVLFRAPYGALNEELVKALPELGYRAVGWSIDSEDWRGITEEEIKQKVINGLHPGSIVLMHSAGENLHTADALDELIPYLRKEGYQFVTVAQMWEAEFK